MEENWKEHHAKRKSKNVFQKDRLNKTLLKNKATNNGKEMANEGSTNTHVPRENEAQ